MKKIGYLELIVQKNGNAVKYFMAMKTTFFSDLNKGKITLMPIIFQGTAISICIQMRILWEQVVHLKKGVSDCIYLIILKMDPHIKLKCIKMMFFQIIRISSVLNLKFGQQNFEYIYTLYINDRRNLYIIYIFIYIYNFDL